VLTRHQATEIARIHLREEGSPWAVCRTGLRRNDRLGLWRIGYFDPDHPDEILDGGELAVWDDGHVQSIGSAPAERDMVEAEIRFKEALMAALVLPSDWLEQLGDEVHKQYWEELQIFLRDERSQYEVHPPEEQVFAAFHLTPYADTRVVILGQDPYPTTGQAHGLCFSVPRGMAKPRSLGNIHKVLKSDCGFESPSHGNLEGWARQGVLLLNTTLTVRHGKAGSHIGEGWEEFTDEVIRALNKKSDRVVFLLWGSEARRRKKLVDSPPHAVIEAGHPVARPNAHLQFLTERPFSQANQALVDAGLEPIDWSAL
jgi:uracil-DNA glycosylase